MELIIERTHIKGATVAPDLLFYILRPEDGHEIRADLPRITSLATSTASYTIMLYGPYLVPNSAVGSNLLVSTSGTTASTAIAGANYTPWPKITFMPAGQYGEFIEFASTTHDYQRQSNQTIGAGVCQMFVNGTNQAPSSTAGAFVSTGSNCPYISTQMATSSNTY